MSRSSQHNRDQFAPLYAVRGATLCLCKTQRAPISVAMCPEVRGSRTA